jgi:hypothetical protein
VVEPSEDEAVQNNGWVEKHHIGHAAQCLLVLGALPACGGAAGYVGTVPSGVKPPSTQLRAAYCGGVWRKETERASAARSTGGWLLGLGVGAAIGAGSTFLARTQTETRQTDKTLHTVGSTLALSGAASVIAGVVVLATNDHDTKASRAAALATEIVAEGEKPLEMDDLDELTARNESTRRLFQQCLDTTVDRDGDPAGTPPSATSTSNGRAAK